MNDYDTCKTSALSNKSEDYKKSWCDSFKTDIPLIEIKFIRSTPDAPAYEKGVRFKIRVRGHTVDADGNDLPDVDNNNFYYQETYWAPFSGGLWAGDSIGGGQIMGTCDFYIVSSRSGIRHQIRQCFDDELTTNPTYQSIYDDDYN